MSATECVEPSLAAALDGLVHQALERAGNRHWGRLPRGVKPGDKDMIEMDRFHVDWTVSTDQIDSEKLLYNAWKRAPVLAARYGLDAEVLASHVDSYTRALLTMGREHTWNNACVLARQVLIANSRRHNSRTSTGVRV